jgi:2-keto-3-deoxy-L-rhamnonate aldolase RhmA
MARPVGRPRQRGRQYIARSSSASGDHPMSIHDSRMKQFRERVRAREPMTCIFVGGNSPEIVELVGHAGFDIVAIDMEHGAISAPDLHNLVRAADAVGIPTIVRIAEMSRSAVLSALDAGAAGILAPAVETVEQARELVRLTRYPPIGDRSAAHYTRALRYSRGMQPSSFVDYDQNVLTGVLIETPAGMRAAAEIMKEPHIDFVVTGKMDLAIRCEPRGLLKNVDEQLLELGPLAAAHGKSIAGAITDAASARRYLDSGYNILVTATYPLFMNAAVAFAEMAKTTISASRDRQ